MIIKLPLTSDASQSFTTQLGTVKYDFAIRYNDRGAFWFMDVTDNITQTKLISGMPLRLGTDLLNPYILSNGLMIAYDEEGTSTEAGDPDTGDLGNRVNVYWFSADEAQ